MSRFPDPERACISAQEAAIRAGVRASTTRQRLVAAIDECVADHGEDDTALFLAKQAGHLMRLTGPKSVRERNLAAAAALFDEAAE